LAAKHFSWLFASSKLKQFQRYRAYRQPRNQLSYLLAGLLVCLIAGLQACLQANMKDGQQAGCASGMLAVKKVFRLACRQENNLASLLTSRYR